MSLLFLLLRQSIRSICDSLLRLPTLGQPLLTQQTYVPFLPSLFSFFKPDAVRDSFQCFQSLFDKATHETFPGPKYALGLLQSLSQLQPSRIDVQPTIQYANLMKSGYLALHKLDREHSRIKLPSIFAFLVDNLLSDSTAVVAATTQALMVCIHTRFSLSLSLSLFYGSK